MASTVVNSIKTSSFSANESSKSSFPQQIKTMTSRMQKKEGSFLKETLQYIKESDIQFYGIHRDAQIRKSHIGNTDVTETVKTYQEIKSHVLFNMKLDPQTPIFQVIGDSAPYSLKGTEIAMTFLKEQIPHNAVILYGFTGHDSQDGTKCVNAATSEHAIQNRLIDRTIGNLVGFHTPAALEGWGCTGPDLKHYFLVYGDDESRRETGTVFGDDVTTSDFFSDTLLMLEGGIQSFRQACNFLMLNKPIIAISDLRGDKTRFGITENGLKKNYFSAPEFLQFIKAKIVGTSSEKITDEFLDSLLKTYLEDHLLADPKRNDYDTKRKLLDSAWALFKSEKLVTKLINFKVV